MEVGPHPGAEMRDRHRRGPWSMSAKLQPPPQGGQAKAGFLFPASQTSRGKLGAEVEGVSLALREYTGQQDRTKQDTFL